MNSDYKILFQISFDDFPFSFYYFFIILNTTPVLFLNYVQYDRFFSDVEWR